MGKDLLQKAMEASGKTDDIFGDSEQPKRTITYNEKGIFTKEIIEGEEMIGEYTDPNNCMFCKKWMLIGQTGACPVCDKVVTEEQYKEYIKNEYKKEVKELSKKEKGFIGKIIEETGLSKKEILELVEEKKVELKGLISQEGALFLIGKELGIDLEFPKETENIDDIFGDSPKTKESKPKEPSSKEEITKRQKELDPNQEEIIDFALALKEVPKQQAMLLPSKEEVDYQITLIKYIKNEVVDKEDYGEMYGQTFLKASGYDKFVSYFKLKVSYPVRDNYEDKDGWHSDVICKVEWGNQSVEAYGGASMLTMTIKKTRHNMKALAETRAKTRAVRVIMGFSKPSYEEMVGSDVDEIFGG